MFFVVSFFAWLFPSTCHGLSRHNNKLGEKVSYDSNEMEDKARCLIWIHRKTVLTVVKFHKLLFLENHCISEHILLFFLCLHGFPSTCLCLICCNGNHDENVHVTAIKGKSNLNVLCMNPSTNYISLHWNAAWILRSGIPKLLVLFSVVGAILKFKCNWENIGHYATSHGKCSYRFIYTHKRCRSTSVQ